MQNCWGGGNAAKFLGVAVAFHPPRFRKICQRLDLDHILLRLLIMTSQNINLFTLTHYFIVIQVLSHQSTLKLI